MAPPVTRSSKTVVPDALLHPDPDAPLRAANPPRQRSPNGLLTGLPQRRTSSLVSGIADVRPAGSPTGDGAPGRVRRPAHSVKILEASRFQLAGYLRARTALNRTIDGRE
ncbi:hypothetical protein OVY01_02800 [Robbsia sp. Bb-Pol-6]|uniref:Uncharacterized protein n=1 Tax=Robbsia betulipollinis TaxID=2981849 RepID=A0ABT3ZIL1_9BURK|nr:hypothetical protein [Robbsia betulipollinis]MCY0386192.1 hypothetical protein [Robbsia betulipollinis]